MEAARLPKALGLSDLVLLKIAAIVNLSFIPVVAVAGPTAAVLWVVAFVTFFLPEAVAVLELSARYPDEGGVYLWTRREFGERHGFVSGWCYWINNLFYLPMQAIYLAGIAAFVSSRAEVLGEQKLFVASLACGWLLLTVVLNIVGLRVGKWLQNLGAVAATAAAVALIALAAATLAGPGAATSFQAASFVPHLFEPGTLALLSVMPFAFVGLELASVMGDEIRHPRRDLPLAIVIAGTIALAAYVVSTLALLVMLRPAEVGVIQGTMQAVARGATRAGRAGMVSPFAIFLAISIGGGISAWFAGSARVPFVAGLDRALPSALGRIHPRWQSPHVAILTQGALCALFIMLGLTGSSVHEAYAVLLGTAVVLQLIPFVYMFLALARRPSSVFVPRGVARGAGVLGTAASSLGIVAAFVPWKAVDSVWAFELKTLTGCLLPILIGVGLFARGRRARAVSTPSMERSA